MIDEKLRVYESCEPVEMDVHKICAERQTLERAPPLTGRQDGAIGVLISDFRSKGRIASDDLLNLAKVGSVSDGIVYGRERL